MCSLPSVLRNYSYYVCPRAKTCIQVKTIFTRTKSTKVCFQRVAKNFIHDGAPNIHFMFSLAVSSSIHHLQKLAKKV